MGSTKTKATKQVVNRIATLVIISTPIERPVPNVALVNTKMKMIKVLYTLPTISAQMPVRVDGVEHALVQMEMSTKSVTILMPVNQWHARAEPQEHASMTTVNGVATKSFVVQLSVNQVANRIAKRGLPLMLLKQRAVRVQVVSTKTKVIKQVVQPAVPINTKMKWAKPVVNLATPVISPILVKLHVLDVLPVNTTASMECAKIAKVANIKITRTKAVANSTVMSVTTLTAIKRLVYRVVQGNTKMKTTKQAVAKLIVPPVITLKTIKRRVCRVVRVNTKMKAIN